ncbi:MAG TPA: histidine kinase [Lacibacter sp.]|nr:histidine kinase [Lacibacter sp.]
MIPFCITWFLWISVHQLSLYYMGVDWFTALTDSIVSNALLIFEAILLLTMLRFYLPRINGFIFLIVWVATLTAGWFFACTYLLELFIQNDSYHQRIHQSWPIRVAIGFLMNGISSVIGYAYFNWQEKTETEKQKTETQQLNKDAELYKLRQQLQPHFLFNALNSINALIGSSPAQARTMVHQLSDFLRGTLRKEDQQWIPLQEELHTVQLYLEIEKVRFGNRLSAEVNMDEHSGTAMMPPMLLQPLMENAIKFGLYDTTDAITIRLTACRNRQELEVTIENPFETSAGTLKKGTGFGLNSVQRRLFLLFNRNDLLRTETKDNIFVTKVIIPQLETRSNLYVQGINN